MIGGNHIDDWGCYADVSDNCDPKLQAGQLKTQNTYKGGDFINTFSFELVFSKVPVVVAVMTGKGHHSANVAIHDITKKGFKYTIMEPHGWDAPHITETVTFIAAIPGESSLTDGITMQAGVIETKETVGSGKIFKVGAPAHNTRTGKWETVKFPKPFAETPALFTGLQTLVNHEDKHGELSNKEVIIMKPWLVPAVHRLNNESFKLSMDRCEARGGNVSRTEKMGWIAFTPGEGKCRKTSCFSASFSVQHAETSGKLMGWDDKKSTMEVVRFPEHFEKTPIAVVSKVTRNGGDGGWMRLIRVNKREVYVVVDEDTSNDKERKHVSEDVGVIAFSEPFVF